MVQPLVNSFIQPPFYCSGQRETRTTAGQAQEVWGEQVLLGHRAPLSQLGEVSRTCWVRSVPAVPANTPGSSALLSQPGLGGQAAGTLCQGPGVSLRPMAPLICTWVRVTGG